MSRESELYKDKVEVSLDGRQIFYLFFGGAVIVGMVFVLGVMVGRRVEARGHVDRVQVAANIDPLAALDQLESNHGLSFHGALRGADAPVSDVEKAIAARPKPDPVKPDKKADKQAAADKAAADKAAADKAAADKAAADKAAADKAAADKAAADKAAADKAAERKLAAEKAEADKKLAAEKAEADKKPAEVDANSKPRFTLQLSSFQDKAEAAAYLETIKASGHAAYITEGEVDGKQYFRVRMGSYRSLDAANEAKAELERTTKRSALVTRI
jgi:cell division septation protein DedD